MRGRQRRAARRTAGRDPNAAAEQYTVPGNSHWGNCPPLWLAATRRAPRSTIDLLAAKGADVGCDRVRQHRRGGLASGGTRRSRIAELARALGGTHGADLNAQARGGYTPMHYAAENGKTAAARELLELGADASLRNTNGQTALQLAEQQTWRNETAQPLHEHEAVAVAAAAVAAVAAAAAVAAEEHARQCGLADAAMPPGTRLRIDLHVDGT